MHDCQFFLLTGVFRSLNEFAQKRKPVKKEEKGRGGES
jgi:hypothetical protein